MSLVRFRQAVKNFSPGGYWPLDEISGTTAFDISGNDRHGTYTGTYTLSGTTSPLTGSRALLLAGAGYVSIPDNDVFTATSAGMTIIAVLRGDTDVAAASRMWIMTKSTGSTYEWGVALNPTGGANSVGNSLWTGPGGAIAEATVVTPMQYVRGRWHLWIARFPGVATTDYPLQSIDGFVLTNSTLNSTGSGVTNTSGAPLIGARGDNAELKWNGGICEVAFVARDIGNSGVTALWRALKAFVPSPL